MSASGPKQTWPILAGMSVAGSEADIVASRAGVRFDLSGHWDALPKVLVDRETSPANSGPSIERCGQACEKRRVGAESFGYELCEQPHAFRLARLSLRQN